MTEYALLFKLADLSVTAFFLFLLWRLVDKWAGRFLEQQSKQVAAMELMAKAVGESKGEQQDLTLAVRALASKIDEQRGWLKQIDEDLRDRRLAE